MDLLRFFSHFASHLMNTLSSYSAKRKLAFREKNGVGHEEKSYPTPSLKLGTLALIRHTITTHVYGTKASKVFRLAIRIYRIFVIEPVR